MKDLIFILILIVLFVLGFFLTGGFGKFMDKINPLIKKADNLRKRFGRDKSDPPKP